MIYLNPEKNILAETLIPFSIAWLYPDSEESYLDNPSNRLRRFQIAKFLKRIPYIQVKNFFQYHENDSILEKLVNFDVIVMFNLSPIDVQICEKFKDKILIFDHCERLFGFANEDFIMKNVSAITCCSSALAKTTEYYLIQSHLIEDPQIFVIRDPIDDELLSFNGPISQENVALLLGMGGNINYALPVLAPSVEKAGYKIKIISEKNCENLGHDFVAWDRNTWIKEALTCSVALCFHDPNVFPAKGNVKVTTPMALGFPVIASPIESYREAIEVNQYTGYIATNQEEWENHLIILKNPALRNLIGLRARLYVLREYSTEKIGLDYVAMIQKLLNEKETEKSLQKV